MSLHSRHQARRARTAATACAVACLSLCAGTPAAAAWTHGSEVDAVQAGAVERLDAPDAGGLWMSLGALSGSAKPDGGLADYQWHTLPRMAWGAQALAGTGSFAAGVRFWQTQTKQEIRLPGETIAPIVRSTSWEVIARQRIATLWGNRIMATGSTGLLHLGYQPDQVTFDPGSGSPVTVDFKPVNEWIGGGGVAVMRTIAADWTVGLEVDHRIYRLDTAHRNGNTIEFERETFGDWSARLELAWLYRRQ